MPYNLGTAPYVHWSNTKKHVLVISCFFTSLCFAEFGSSIPKSGNPYLYVYSAFGEFAGFITGWSFAIGYLMSGALSARAWSGYFDSLIGNIIQNYTTKLVGTWTIGDPIAEHPDFVAVLVLIIFMTVAMGGVQCSASVTNILAIMNCIVLTVFSIVGFIYGSTDNWINVNHGGFFPFGIVGIMQGSAAAFFAFFGYENICIAAEESKNYSKSVPRALIGSLLIAALLYIGTSSAFTLLVPYYDVSIDAPITDALTYTNITWLRYIMYVGPMCGLSNILLLNGYTFSRLLFSLAEEGLLWKGFATVNRRTKAPIRSLIICIVVEGTCAFFLNIEHLFKFYVIVSIVTFSLICFGILKLRYDSHVITPEIKHAVQNGDAEITTYHDSQNNHDSLDKNHKSHDNSFSITDANDDIPENYDERDAFLDDKDKPLSPIKSRSLKCCKENHGNMSKCVLFATSVIPLNIYIFVIAMCAMVSALLVMFHDSVSVVTFVMLHVTSFVVVSVCTFVISRFQLKEEKSSFKVPFVPVFPVIAAVINIFFLVSTFDVVSLVGFAILIFVGMLVYLGMCYYDRSREANPTYTRSDSQVNYSHVPSESNESMYGDDI